MSKQPCKYFLENRCNRGANCRYSHDVQADAIRGGTGSVQGPSGGPRNTRYRPGIVTAASNAAQLEEAINGLILEAKQTIPQGPRRAKNTRRPTNSRAPAQVPEAQKNEPPPEPQKEEPPTQERIMGGSMLVRFGPGLEIQSLSFTDVTSPTVVLENFPQGTQPQEVHNLALAFKADLPKQAVRLLNKGDKSQAVIHFEDMGAANAAIRALDGKLHNGASLVAKALKPTAASEDVTKIECTWFQPAKAAYLQFVSEAAAAAALATGRTKEIRGRRIKPLAQSPRPRFARPYSVLLLNLDLETTEEDLRGIFTFDAMTMKDAKFNVPREDTIAYIRSLFDGTRIKDLRALSQPHDDLQRIVITVESAEDARRFHRQYEGKKHEFLGQTTLGLNLTYSATFKIPSDIYKAIKGEVDALAKEEREKEKAHRDAKGKDEDAPARLLIHDRHMPVSIGVHGKGRPAVVRVKTAIQKLLRGEIVCGEDGQALWDPALRGPDGRRIILNIKNQTGVYINCDARNQRLTLYGSLETRTAAKIELAEEYQKLLNRQFEIPLYNHAYQNLIRGGLNAVQEHLGADKVILDVTRRVLVVRCSPAELEKVRSLVIKPSKAAQKRAENAATSEGSCPVCLETATEPIKGQCGHVYCKSCAQEYVRSVLTTQQYPIICFGEDATCNAGFSIGVVKSLLPAADVDRLFERGFMAYIQKRPLEYSFCPTPDCSTVYSVTTTGAVFTCSQCFVGICTTCKTECHEGQTCEEYQIATNPELDEKKLQEWKEKSGVKKCPNCKASVEKNDGCHHMTCILCRAHWCWLCTQSFPTGEEVYEHLGSCNGQLQENPTPLARPPAFDWQLHGDDEDFDYFPRPHQQERVAEAVEQQERQRAVLEEDERRRRLADEHRRQAAERLRLVEVNRWHEEIQARRVYYQRMEEQRQRQAREAEARRNQGGFCCIM
ncbi:hypothetical protein FN846DRAFT_811207 [Sphaerosporella brunnea]|uniref:Uncharacterized protein n=1 Tax=Sphaerosporella brunnea TaxID=1250544 RepID=A0A5J5F0R6_9PEZI|nr:hypothetical protein FN846DRAFT_811207 [Sphaerosporella brunnea]